MMKRYDLLLFFFLCAGSWQFVTAQEKPESGLQKEFEAAMKLLQQERPNEAEHLLNQLPLRVNQNSFKLGNSVISTYAFSSILLINTYLHLNDYSNAERVAQDRVTWAEQQYGAMAFQVGGFLNLLADIDRLQGKYKEAEPLYLRSLSIHRFANLADCLVAKEIYTGLGETYLALNRPREAQDLLKPAIDACRDKFGEKGMGRSDLLDTYAVALENDKKPEEAIKAALEAERVGYPDPRFEQEARDLLRGRLLAAQGHFDEAASLCRKWITVFEVPDGPESDRRLMLPLDEYARILRAGNRTKEAAEVEIRLKEIKTKYNLRF